MQIEPCTHEEAGTRLIRHLLDGTHAGYEKIMIRTFDKSIRIAHKVWISFGVGCTKGTLQLLCVYLTYQHWLYSIRSREVTQ